MAATELGKRTDAQAALRGARLDGLTAIVTGASSGIGVETARVLAQAGAEVTLACRSLPAGERTRQDLLATLPRDRGSIHVVRLDLSDFDSVRELAGSWPARPLDLLINNAGIMAPPLQLAKQGGELQMATNHLGHFLLTNALRPQLERAAAPRVVNLSSSYHLSASRAGLLATLDSDPQYRQRRYRPFSAYADSKLANVLFTRALARRLPPHALAFAVHPGVIGTGLLRHMKLSGGVLRLVLNLFSKSVAQGAATSIFAATAPELRGRSGAYLADCAEAPSSPLSHDLALMDQVWELSQHATRAGPA